MIPTDSENPTAEKSDEWWASDEFVLDRVKKARKDAQQTQSEWVEQATEAYNFVAGKQWSVEEQAALEQNNRAPAALNWIGRIVNAVCGQQVANRQETRYLGREESDFNAAETFTQIAQWVREQADEEDQESEAFRDLIITGMGWTARRMEYDEDQDGKIAKDRIDPRRMRWDQASRKKNLADSRWVQCDYWYSKEELEERWPEKAEEIAASPDGGGPEDRKGQPHDATRDWRYEKNAANLDRTKGQYRVVHHVEWRKECVGYTIADEQGQVITLSEEQYDVAEDRAEEMGMPLPPAAKIVKRVYYEAWTVGGVVLESGQAPLQRGFVYQCMTGLRDEESATYYGLVRPMLDPQRFSNTLFGSVLHTLKTNAKGGLIAESDAVDNVQKFEESWAKSDAVSWVRPGANAGGKIAPKTPPIIPPQMEALARFFVESIPMIGGVNPDLLGQSEDVKPGVVEAMRTKAGLVILAPWFDALRLYMKRDGRVLAEMINRFIADGRKARIVGDFGAQYVPILKQPDHFEYDVIVDESTQSRDVKERSFAALMHIVPMALQAGLPVPPEVIQYAPIPGQLQQKWMEQIKQKMSQPPPKPVQVQVAEIKAQTDQQKVAAQAQVDERQTMVEAEQQRQIETYQAESQVAISREKLAADSQMARFQAMLDQQQLAFEQRMAEQKAALDAHLKILEANLKRDLMVQQSAARVQEAKARAKAKPAPTKQ